MSPPPEPRARLLIWSDATPPRGISAIARALAHGMAARDFAVTLAAPAVIPAVPQDEPTNAIAHVALPADIASLLGEIAPDVVLFADTSALSSLAAKAPVAARGIPMIVVLGGVLEQQAAAAQGQPAFAASLAAARHVICTSRHNQKLLRERYPIGSAVPTLITPGCPPRFFAPVDEARRAAMRRDLGVAADDILFFTAARHEAAKGFGLFVLALKALRARPVWPRLKFVWAGDGSARAKLAEMIAAEGLAANVTLLGPRDDIDALLDAADVFVLPSYAESTPLAIMEAMAKAVPVIVSAVGGILEMVADTAIVAIHDPNASASAGAGNGFSSMRSRKLAAQPERRTDLGRRGKQRAERLFRDERMVTDYWRLIADAVPRDIAKPHDYVSPGLKVVHPDAGFPFMVKGNTGECDWPSLRRAVPHHWYVDRRSPQIGFLTRDEAQIVYNTALLFGGQPALEIGGFTGWSSCHLALAGVQLDVVDPLLANDAVRASAEESLTANQVRARVNLVAQQGLAAVQDFIAAGKRWPLIVIDDVPIGDAPRLDAAAIEACAADDAIVFFHNVLIPAIADTVRALRDRGWHIRLYETMQVMAAAWRGAIAPPDHVPDPALGQTLPLYLADLADAQGFGALQPRVKPYTMTSLSRQYALHQAVKFITDRKVPGEIVECGVWRGGSMMLTALTLLAQGVSDRRLMLYDTFDGMTAPTVEDVEASTGALAGTLLAALPRDDVYWALAPLDQVKANLASTGYPLDRIEYIAGDVCATLPLRAPQPIALLRLDTDWYASTRAELEHLYAQLVPGGVLIVDDYGHWEGSRRACDEFFARHPGTLIPVPDELPTAYYLVKEIGRGRGSSRAICGSAERKTGADARI